MVMYWSAKPRMSVRFRSQSFFKPRWRNLVDAWDLKSLGYNMFMSVQVRFWVNRCIFLEMTYIIKRPISITFKKSVLFYFENLIKLDKNKNVSLRLFVQNPCTIDAHINLIYCYYGEELESDIKILTKRFCIFIEEASIQALRNAILDYVKDGRLVIKAPYIKGVVLLKSLNLKSKIVSVLNKEINPILSSHGGFVKLVNIVKNNILILKFEGNCTGCGLLSLTLEKTIKKIIKRNFPNIRKILDYASYTIKY